MAAACMICGDIIARTRIPTMARIGKNQNLAVRRQILARIRKVTGAKRVGPEMSLKTLGIDSITALELVMDLEREFNIQVPDEKLSELVTVQAIIDLVETLLSLHVA